MIMQEYSTEQLVTQPIGYWSGAVYRAVTARIRSSLDEDQLTQPHWWTLNQVAGAPGKWSREQLTDKLLPYADSGVEFAPVFDDLITRGWMTEESGSLTLSETGEAGRLRARDRNARAHELIHEGISSEEYAATLNVLRRMVANLGGDSNLPT